MARRPSPFGLPPAWNPGYALPDNVKDEGLERRGLVTKQMPRGTYDDPRVGTGGYVTPSYVRQEGYGQGAFVTKWLPRGTTFQNVPQWIQRQPTVVGQRSIGRRANVVTIQRRSFSGFGGLSAVVDDEPPMPALFQEYGDRAAGEILARITPLPPAQRKQALRAVMDQVDRSLWNRTAEITRRYVAKGMSASVAFHKALARALAAGIAAEMVRAGQTGRAPQANSLLGLGCYGTRQGASGFGADAVWTQTTPPVIKPPTDGKYRPGGGTGTATPTGHLRFPGSPDWAGGMPSPFEFPLNPEVGRDNRANVRSPLAIPPSWVAYLNALLTAMPGQSGAQPAPDNPWWRALGFAPGQMVRVDLINNRKNPVDRIEYQGITWNLYIEMLPDWNAPDMLSGVMARCNSLISGNCGGRDVVGVASGIVKGVTTVLGTLACGVAKSPAAPAAGAAAGMGAGVGPGAGMAGANVAKNACGQPMMPYPPIQPQDNILPMIILGGGVLVAVALLGGKKKPEPSKP